MPAKGSCYKSGKRNVIIDKKFYNEFIKETKLDIDYQTFRTIILESNSEIAGMVAESEDGFKLPENLGYVVVTKYQSKKQPIDWINSRRLRRKILLTNLHSFGYIHHIKWFKMGVSNLSFKDVYKLEPARLLKRNVAKNVKEGKTYHTWSNSDFWAKSKILKKLLKNRKWE